MVIEAFAYGSPKFKLQSNIKRIEFHWVCAFIQFAHLFQSNLFVLLP